MKKVDVNIKASNEVGHRVLLGKINNKRPACMKDTGKQQNAKRQKKTELFVIILFFVLILIAVLRVTGPIAITAWNIFFKS